MRVFRHFAVAVQPFAILFVQLFLNFIVVVILPSARVSGLGSVSVSVSVSVTVLLSVSVAAPFAAAVTVIILSEPPGKRSATSADATATTSSWSAWTARRHRERTLDEILNGETGLCFFFSFFLLTMLQTRRCS